MQPAITKGSTPNTKFTAKLKEERDCGNRNLKPKFAKALKLLSSNTHPTSTSKNRSQQNSSLNDCQNVGGKIRLNTDQARG